MFLQERYGQFSLTDPFLALQRDFESGTESKDRRPVSASPITVLEAVMAHCRKMQERMSAQLSAAETRQKRVRPQIVCLIVYVYVKQSKTTERIVCDLFQEYLHILSEISPPFL